MSAILDSNIERIKKGRWQFDHWIEGHQGRLVRTGLDVKLEIPDQSLREEVLSLVNDDSKLKEKFGLSKNELLYFEELQNEFDSIRMRYGLE